MRTVAALGAPQPMQPASRRTRRAANGGAILLPAFTGQLGWALAYVLTEYDPDI